MRRRRASPTRQPASASTFTTTGARHDEPTVRTTIDPTPPGESVDSGSAWECLTAVITVDRRARLGSHPADARDAVIESRQALTIRVGAFVLGTGILTAQLLGALSSSTPLLVIGVSLCGPVAAATLGAMADKLVAAR